MSIKYNQFGEVVSVNGIVTGQHLGKPMQDAIAERPEDNEPYAREYGVVTNVKNVEEYVPQITLPVMTVNISHSSDSSSNVATSDKTYEEIMAHYNAGGEVRAFIRKEGYTSIKAILSVSHYNDYYVFFSGTTAIPDTGGTLNAFNSAMIYGVTVGLGGTFCSIKAII